MTVDIWSAAQLRVLAMVRSRGPLHAYGVSMATRLQPKTVYQILQRFEARGLINGTTERVQSFVSARTPKVFYTLTTSGADHLATLRGILGPST